MTPRLPVETPQQICDFFEIFASRQKELEVTWSGGVTRLCDWDGFSYSEEVYSVEDWLLYRQLRDAGLYGCVIPAALMRYRVRHDSMYREVGLPHHERIVEEMSARARESRTRWLLRSA